MNDSQGVPIRRVGRGQAGRSEPVSVARRQPPAPDAPLQAGGRGPKKEQIEVLLARLEDTVASAKTVPLTDKCMIPRDDVLFMLRMVRDGLPEELAQAKWLLEQNKQLIAEARKEAEAIRRDAEAQTARMLDEHELTQQAKVEANAMREQASAESQEMCERARQYAKGVLDDLDRQLTEMLVYIKKNNKELA